MTEDAPSASQIARKHFDNAVDEASSAGYDADVLARYMLGCAVSKYLEKRSVKDVRSELTFRADHCDPGTDYVFMRP